MNVKNAFIVCSDKKEKNVFDVVGTRVIFKTISSMGQTPNTLSIQMYGADDVDVGRVIDKAHTVSLYAGTLDKEGKIGAGQVISAKLVPSREGVFLDIVAVDGDDFYSTPLNRSISAGLTLEELAIELVALSGATTGIGQISRRARDVALPRGVSVIGSPVQTIRNVAKAINAAFYVNQSLVYIVCPDEMIGSPISIDEGDLISDTIFDGYYSVITVNINANITVGRSVSLPEAKANSPLYRVLKVQTEGDTRNPVWRMSIEGAEQTAVGFAQSATTSGVWR